MGGIGSGYGTKRPDHPVGHWMAGRTTNYPDQKKHLKSVFSDKPDPSCHGHKRERDRLAGLPDTGAKARKDRDARLCNKEAMAMAVERKNTIAMEARELQDLARQLATKAMKALVDILDNEDSSDTAKMQAIQMILDRGFGKPAATVYSISQDAGTKLSDLDGKSLDQRIEDAIARTERLTAGASEAPSGENRPANLRKYN